jgi:hypothetical protein
MIKLTYMRTRREYWPAADTPQILLDQTFIHDDPLGVSAASRYLKDMNQHFRTRRPYIDRGNSVHM